MNNKNILSQFKLPIEYVQNSKLNDDIVNDIELGGENSLYKFMFNNQTELGNIITNKWNLYYTTNTHFLADFQILMKKYKHTELTDYNYYKHWNEFKNQTAFKEKYSFIEWEHLEFCNKSPQFLQLLTIYNLTSPIISLIIPIVFLIMPFIIIKFVMKAPITFDIYKTLLYKQFRNHAFGKLIKEFSSRENWDKKIYALAIGAFYIFSLYQNVLSCYKFYKNIYRIQKFLYLTKQHICYSLNNIDNFLGYIEKLGSFKGFIQDLIERKQKLLQIKELIQHIHNEEFNIKNIHNIGTYMSNFYTIFNDEEITNTIEYSFGILGFLDNLNGLKKHITERRINKCSFGKKTKIKKQYYLPHIMLSHVNNSVDLDKKYMITGPNASGKTTILKSTLLNLIFSQQIGFGCYKTATINPFNFFYSYLNIPETSGRDSLFQAEARKCLDILKNIQSHSHLRHFCIFDELYSGTNPQEAIIAAKSYLLYLSELNVSFMLTTHYHKVCSIHKKDKSIINKQMLCSIHNNIINYKYKLVNGISYIKGGFNVLYDLEYPTEITHRLQTL